MSGRYFLGIVLVLLGLGFLLNSAGIIQLDDIISTYWPSILIIIGVFQLIKRNAALLSGLIITTVGLYFQLRNLNMLPENSINYFWPIILIIAGVGIIFSKTIGGDKINEFEGNEEDIINYFTMFSGLETKNMSKNFKGGNTTALFGGVDIDLRDADLAEEGATLELTTAFGGIDVKVPVNWKVVVTGIPLFGGWENQTKFKNNNENENVPVLKVKCLALFGGIEIKN